MASRSKARKRALDAIFEADQRGTDPRATIDERSAQAQVPFGPYAFDLVSGVSANRPEIDAIIGEYATGWTLDRMPAVDRAILRLGTYELLWVGDVPHGVAISEAVLLARELSTDASPGFVNGLLAKVADVEPARAALAEPEDDPGAWDDVDQSDAETDESAEDVPTAS